MGYLVSGGIQMRLRSPSWVYIVFSTVGKSQLASLRAMGRESGARVAWGMVQSVFQEGSNVCKVLRGHAAIGHVRYSTTGKSTLLNSQPLYVKYSKGPIAVAHNGNLVNAMELRRRYENKGSIFRTGTDTEIILHLLADQEHTLITDALPHVLGHLKGAYTLLFLFPDRIEAVRDPLGIRPLCLGKTQNGHHVVASESCALDAIQADYIREVEPGEIVTLGARGFSSRRIVAGGNVRPAHCIFEHVYFAKQNSVVFGDNVHRVRVRLGRRLAFEHPIVADVVIPIPDSGTSAAIGYAAKSNTPFDMGFVRSHFVGRTFMLPDQKLRVRHISLKLAVVREVVKGRRVVVVDDSIVRGNTIQDNVVALRQAGAREVHLRVSCPPICFPCFYGVDFPTSQELLANSKTVKQIRDYLEVDTVGYLSLEGLVRCVTAPSDHYCTACWTGEYRIPIPEHDNQR